MIENYFEKIDTPNKAYWLGFIWCDGYVSKTENRFVIGVKASDKEHLYKLLHQIDCHVECKTYNYSDSAYTSTEPYTMFYIHNQKFCTILRTQYGLIPHRTDCTKLIQNIPDIFVRDFIRGVVDADGWFGHYTIQHKGYTCNKYKMDIGSNTQLLPYIENVLIENGCINNYRRKLYKRHSDQKLDGDYRTLPISGGKQVVNVLKFLYNNCESYLNRKYEKYLQIINAQ